MKNNIDILKLSIEKSVPEIFRIIQVPLNYTLFELHKIIQSCFLWSDSEIFAFNLNGNILNPEYLPGTLLVDVFNDKSNKLTYLYDPKDDWLINIDVQGFFFTDNLSDFPFCSDGQNASPPEGIGGILAYQELCLIINDSGNPKHKSALEILGIEFDPTVFDPEEINYYLLDEGEMNSEFFDEFDDIDGFGITNEDF